MLLLYPGLNPIFALNAQFTFHYASTLSIAVIQKSVAVSYLHSTMLLLYPGRTLSRMERHQDLHSTMLLLYPFPTRYRLAVSCDLHSTMLLLYRNGEWYSNDIRNDLHSTMLLLYLVRRLLQVFPFKSIYIPLCFYFIPHTSYSLQYCMCIYIPLCFYFIRKR